MSVDNTISPETIRFYASLPMGGDFELIYRRGELDAVVRYLSEIFFKRSVPPNGARLEIEELPSRRSLDGKLTDEARRLYGGLLVRIATDAKTWESIRAVAEEAMNQGKLVGVGVDLPIYSTRHWCPGSGGGPFASRAAAERLMGVQRLRQDQPQLRGAGVNVALFDHGVDGTALGANYGGGWPGGAVKPGKTLGTGHGMAMARQILSIAPDALIFDYPVLPPRLTNVPGFLGQVQAAYSYFRAQVGVLGGRWIAVNSWSTFNRASELPAGSYSNNPNHPFNLKITEVIEAAVDVVFAAGNCGQFCPDPRCGRNDRGPGSSILGANSHPRVLTVGAVRSDGLWIGYSSQGEGQPNLAREKPDLCAASEFHETNDAGRIATGTSAAAALAAGVIAVLRQQWPATIISPDQLKGTLIATAHQPSGTGWNGRLGYGILDAKAAFEKAVTDVTV